MKRNKIFFCIIFVLILSILNSSAQEFKITQTTAINSSVDRGWSKLYPSGDWYLSSRWNVYEGGGSIFPILRTNWDTTNFIPFAANSFQQEFILTTTADSVATGVKSLIDMPALSGNLLAIIVATPMGDTEQLNPHPTGAWYYGEKWYLFNSDWGKMPPGAKYRIQFFSRSSSDQFRHTATKENIGSEGSYIDNPSLNKNPNAQVKILQNYAPDYRSPYGLNGFEARAAYSSAAERWYIANIKGEAVKVNSSFNVVISNGGIIGSNTDKPVETTTPTPVAIENPTPKTPKVIVTPTPVRVEVPTPTRTPIAIENPNPRTPKTIISPTPSQTPIPTPTPLNGFVDMHTHPMSHLGFGGKLMHGSPDTGLLMLSGTRNCNPAPFRAGTIEQALGSCSSTHGGWGLNNPCGDHLRAAVLNNLFDKHFIYKLPNDILTGNLIGDHQHQGIETNPNFLYFPNQTSKTHQQMWWEWIKRAKEKGNLRVMVALTVNSELLANILNGENPRDDKASANLQLDEMITFISSHGDFMEIAKTPTDLRRIVGDGKLAVILGMEVDNIGNFNKENANQSTVRAEIQRLHNKGVRYIFPVHLVDNKFGGTAVYEDLFNFSNKYSTGRFYRVTPSNQVKFRLGDMSNIGVTLSADKDVKQLVDGMSGIQYPPAAATASFQADPTKPGLCLFPFPNPIPTLGCWQTFRLAQGILRPGPDFPNYNTSPASMGHVNSLGLDDPLGTFAIKEMMKLGMVIDIDHMSDRSQNETLTIAEAFQYPVNIGHNGVRKSDGSERHASIDSIKRIAKLGGIFGVGTADSEDHIADAQTFISSFEAVWSTMALDGGSPRVAIGTDVNGMERLPRATTGLISSDFYSANYFDDIPDNLEENFQRCQTGNRVWDYTREGVAHYGLMADFMRDVRKRSVSVHQRMMDSAEYFAQMWEKVEKQKRFVQ